MDSLIKNLASLNFEKFKTTIDKLSQQEVSGLKETLDNRYYNTGEDTVSDDKYDYISERQNKYSIGCKLRDGDNATKLPFTLNSMDKIKHGETKKLEKFSSKVGEHVSFSVSDKLNGVSCLICYGSKADDIRLYTRGDGEVGADISYFKDKIKGIVTGPTDINVRGELIITKENFSSYYQQDYKNSLAMLVSVINSKSLKEPIKHVQFVAYEIVSDKPGKKPSDALRHLSKLGFETVHSRVMNKLDDNTLYTYLQNRYETSVFSIDGIIINVDAPYDRKVVSASGNPEYAVAYKMVTDSCETEVEDVIWAPSRYSVLKPRIQIKPVELCGATITFVTGSNAKFIQDNRINRGSRVLVIRAGEIIPKIEEVITFSEQGKMPDTPYKWNETGVDIVSIDPDDDTDITVRRLTYFFTTLGVKQFAEGTIRKLVLAGHDDIFKIMDMTEGDFMKIQSFEQKMSKKLRGCLDDLCSATIDMETFMAASSLFGQGIGAKKLKTLMTAIPSLLNTTPTVAQISKVNGFSEKTAEKILAGLEKFKDFYNRFSKYIMVSSCENDTGESIFSKEEIEAAQAVNGISTRLKGEIIVFTNFRDSAMEKALTNAGAEIGDSVTKKTTCLVIPDGNTTASGKITKAMQYKIKVLERRVFVEQYGL